MDYSGRLASNGPLGSWLGISILGVSTIQCYRETLILVLHCHRPISTSLRTKHLSVTFVHSKKKAKQTTDGPNNTELIPSKHLASEEVAEEFFK